MDRPQKREPAGVGLQSLLRRRHEVSTDAPSGRQQRRAALQKCHKKRAGAGCSDDIWQSRRARRDCIRPGTRAPPRLPSRRPRAPSTDLRPPRPPRFAIRAPGRRARGRWAGRPPKNAPPQLQQERARRPAGKGSSPHRVPAPRQAAGRGARTRGRRCPRSAEAVEPQTHAPDGICEARGRKPGAVRCLLACCPWRPHPAAALRHPRRFWVNLFLIPTALSAESPPAGACQEEVRGIIRGEPGSVQVHPAHPARACGCAHAAASCAHAAGRMRLRACGCAHAAARMRLRACGCAHAAARMRLRACGP